MSDSMPIVLIPGLLTSPRLFAEQLPALWRFGPVTIADPTRDESMGGIAERILSAAPRRFSLAGLSLGGYIAFEIMRRAPERVSRLALLDTTARSDTPEQTERRRRQIAKAEQGRLAEIVEEQIPLSLHRDNLNDDRLRAIVRQMAEEAGAETFVRQQKAIIGRPDSRSALAAIRCPTMVLVGDGDELTPPVLAAEMADAIPSAEQVNVLGAGHLSTVEQPAAVARALVEWLQP